MRRVCLGYLAPPTDTPHPPVTVDITNISTHSRNQRKHTLRRAITPMSVAQ